MSKVSWTEYLIELVVVIIGITIAFWLNNWGEEEKNLVSEKNYMESMLVDLRKDKASLESNVDSIEKLIENTTALFSILYNPTRSTSELRHHHITSFYNSLYFKPASGTYHALMGSGNLELIRNFAVKSAISELYTVHYRELEDMDLFVRNLVDLNIYPYMLKNISYSRNGITSDSPLKTVEFTNLAGSFMNISQRRILVYKRVMSETEKLISMIEIDLQ